MSYQVARALQKGSLPVLASTQEGSCHSTCCPAPSVTPPRPCHPELGLAPSRMGQAIKLDLSAWDSNIQ